MAVSEQRQARLDQLAAELDIESEIGELAKAICYRAFAQDLQYNWSAETVLASALYTAARLENRPYDLSEVAAVADADRAQIGRFYRSLTDALDLDTEVADPTEFLTRFCSELDVDNRVATTAQGIIEISLDTGTASGRSPAGIAAGAIYLAGSLIGGEEAPTQPDIADLVQVTQVIVRNRYQEQEDLLGINTGRSGGSLPVASILGTAGLSATEFNELAKRFELIEREPDLFASRARCCRCGHTDQYSHLLRYHQPRRLGGTRLCTEEHFSAADLADQCERFEAVDRDADVEQTYFRCIHCGQTGPYREMIQNHRTRQLGTSGGTRICYTGSLSWNTVAEQVDRFETGDAEFEIVESGTDLNEMRIRCVECGAEGRYGDLARRHQTRYNDGPSCYNRSWGT
jgi:hypothetical protein